MVYRPGQPQNRPTHVPDQYVVLAKLPPMKSLKAKYHIDNITKKTVSDMVSAIDTLIQNEGMVGKVTINNPSPELGSVVLNADAAFSAKVAALPCVKSVSQMGLMYPAGKKGPTPNGP